EGGDGGVAGGGFGEFGRPAAVTALGFREVRQPVIDRLLVRLGVLRRRSGREGEQGNRGEEESAHTGTGEWFTVVLASGGVSGEPGAVRPRVSRHPAAHAARLARGVTSARRVARSTA